MSTEIIGETKKRNYTVTRYWDGKRVMYQITQRYKKPFHSGDWSSRYYGYVQLSRKDIEFIVKKIREKEKEDDIIA